MMKAKGPASFEGCGRKHLAFSRCVAAKLVGAAVRGAHMLASDASSGASSGALFSHFT